MSRHTDTPEICAFWPYFERRDQWNRRILFGCEDGTFWREIVTGPSMGGHKGEREKISKATFALQLLEAHLERDQ